MSDSNEQPHVTVEVEGVGCVVVRGPGSLELARKVLDYYEENLMEAKSDE